MRRSISDGASKRDFVMKIFYCTACKHRVFFENVQCTNCGMLLAFLPDRNTIGALRDSGDETYTVVTRGGSASYRLCKNTFDHASCSWAVPSADPEPFCRACRLNVTIPDLSQPHAKDAWIRLERAKRWLMSNLMSLGLPLPTTLDAEGHRLRFSFLANTKDEQVFTGQSDGLITINIAEADDPFREKIRSQLGETYRTVLGHFRHEIGHYYWDQLIPNSQHLEAFRAEFGDEREDYDAALKRHYESGPGQAWISEFVSSYASMHPWEDWAETWAHYLHIVDTLETARAHDLVVAEKLERGQEHAIEAAAVDFSDFENMIRSWVPFTIALNSLNRSMGLADVYPFVLSDRAVQKLRFVHRVVQDAKAKSDQRPRAGSGSETTASGPKTLNVSVSSR
jgi:hypothetical protein